MNIVLIIIDTLRYDHIGANGNDWIHTPNMDRLAARSWVFDRNFTASYPTIPHRTDVMMGKHGAPFYPWRPLRFDAVTLPEVLAESGYCTQLIHDTPHLVNGGHNFDWPFHAWTFLRGAEVDRPWIDSSQTEFPENWGPDPLFDIAPQSVLAQDRTVLTYARANRKRKRDEDWNAAQLFLTACQWLRDNADRDRFFLWLDCFDPHEPWDAPPDFVRRYDKTPGYDGRIDPRAFVARNDESMSVKAKERVKACYAAKVSWVDRWLGELLDTLAETGLSENTAIVFTADHGTRLGEDSRFGKGYPVREPVGHTPLFITVPGGETGRSDIIVQPQDIFAVVAGLAGIPVPEGLDSHDVLSIARQGTQGARAIALAGMGADGWRDRLQDVLFTAFDADWCLELTARPENCRLTRYGSQEEVSSAHQDVVGALHTAAIAEIERRGADPSLVSWLQGHDEADFPQEARFWDGWPGPGGFTHYFNRLYLGD